MKRLILSLAAAAALAAPLAASSAAQADPWDRGGERHDRGEHRGWDRGEHRGWDRGDDRREEWRDHERREEWRGRGDWDDRRHNGYYYNNRWSYGPPPVSYYSSPYYRPGYSAWRRGAVLPGYYRSYVVSDYYRYHLRPPPRGYAWYRVGDEYLLAAIASGLIFEIINN